MTRWVVDFYEKEIEKFLDSLSEKERAKIYDCFCL